MSGNDLGVGSEEVLLRIAALHSEHWPGNYRSCLGGTTEAVKSVEGVLKAGGGVLTLYHGRSDDENLGTAEALQIAVRNSSPDDICDSLRDSLAILHAVRTTTAIIQQELGLQILPSPSNRAHQGGF